MKNYFCYKTIRELQYVFIYSFETVIKGYKNCIEMVNYEKNLNFF